MFFKREQYRKFILFRISGEIILSKMKLVQDALPANSINMLYVLKRNKQMKIKNGA